MSAPTRPRSCPGPLEACMSAYVVLDRGLARHNRAIPCGACGRRTGLQRWDTDAQTHLCIRCDPLSPLNRKGRTP